MVAHQSAFRGQMLRVMLVLGAVLCDHCGLQETKKGPCLTSSALGAHFDLRDPLESACSAPGWASTKCAQGGLFRLFTACQP